MDAWLAPPSLWLILVGLLVSGFGVPIPEDPLLLAAGVLAHTQGFPLWAMIVACASAVLVADFGLFSIARRLGPEVLDHRLIRRLLPPARRASLERMLERRGDAVVFTARHLPGLRGPIFVLVGIHQLRPTRVLLWDAFGLCITAPVVVAAGWLGSSHIELVRKELARMVHWIGFSALILLGLGWGFVAWRKRRRADHPGSPS